MSPPSLPRFDVIRQLVRRTFDQLGAEGEADIRESLMIRNGLYCGRRLRCGGFQAVWFAEENEIKFYLPDGTLACVEDAGQAREAA